MSIMLRKAFALYRGRIVGTFLGVVFALTYIYFGFFRTLFIVICGGVGYYVGTRVDGDEDLRALIERLLPPVD